MPEVVLVQLGQVIPLIMAMVAIAVQHKQRHRGDRRCADTRSWAGDPGRQPPDDQDEEQTAYEVH